MTISENFDPTTPKLPKLPDLVVSRIPGVLPFDGARNPLTRSHTTKRISKKIATPATDGIPKVYHFDGEREMAVALEAIMSPDFFGLEVQLPAIPYDCPKGKYKSGKRPEHHFDLRLTFTDRFRRCVYVKNGARLKTVKTREEIKAVFEATSDSFADDQIVMNGDDYTRAYRDDPHRFMWAHQNQDPEIVDHVEGVARSVSYWYISDLTKQCDVPHSDAWGAVARLISQGVLCADGYSVIEVNAHVWLAA